MTASVLLPAAMRRTETPNAVMTTLASPTQGPTGRISLWKIAMRPGQPVCVRAWYCRAAGANGHVSGAINTPGIG